MKKTLCILFTFFLAINLLAQNKINTDFGCDNGMMDLIKIESAYDTEKVENYKKNKGLFINVDINTKSENFISDMEQYFRTHFREIDTTNIGYEPDWKYFTAEQKLKVAEIKREEAKKYANEIHNETNQGQQIVNLINTSNKEIQIPSIDGLPAIVLQAKNIQGEWKTIRYIYYNWCGNSYSYNIIPKKSKFNVIVELPENGEFKTKLRFKMFYDNNFIYSNEFEYIINECDFFEKKNIESSCVNCEPTAFNKLDIKPTHWK